MPEEVAILVHGTFSRSAKWIEADSELAHALQARNPGLECIAFRWSGANRHSERISAGFELRRFVGEICVDRPDCRIHLIGHSHGGNVIQYALAGFESASRIESIAFLGTPFLTPVRRELADTFAFFSNVLTIFIGLSATILSIGAIVLLLDAMPTDSIWAIAMFFALLAAPAFLGLLAARAGPPIARHVHQAVSARQELWLADLDVPAPPCRVYVATIPRDEAGILLAVWDRATFAPLWIADSIRSFARGMAWGAGSILALMVGLAVIEGILGNFGKMLPGQRLVDATPDALSLIVLGLLCVAVAALFLSIGAAILAGLLRGTPAAFGGEDALLVLALRIMPRSLPHWQLPPGSTLARFRFERRFGQLRHSIFYDDSDVQQQLSDWIAQGAWRGAEGQVAAHAHTDTGSGRLASRTGCWLTIFAFASALIAVAINPQSLTQFCAILDMTC